MTESGAGGGVKPKRNGARTFKNPPQPHMCIKDFMLGSDLPCYVNVLSWDKVAMAFKDNDTIPLYGGMRLSPPRGEKPEVGVFAVIANPELLKIYGKNAPAPKDRTMMINLLLEYIEAKNEGVYFSRRFIILKDRDITGELKEVWMAVQAKRDRENLAPQQETWIDAQPAPTPQYPQYSDQQQQIQLQLQLHQQQQQQQQADYAQPPQYRSNAAYSMGSISSNESVNHEREIRFNYSQQNPVVTQSEQVYQYTYRERSRANVPQNQTQQNCPAYPAPQYQFQQLPRQMVPQYVNSNVHGNGNPNYANRNYNRKENYKVNQDYDDQFEPITEEERKQVADTIRAETLRVQQQQMRQQQQIQQHQQIQHQQQIQQQQQPINQQGNHQQYQSHQSHQRQQQQQQLQLESEENTNQFLQRSKHRPHMGVAQKSNASKRQIESPIHSEPRILNAFEQAEANLKSISPVKVLHRDSGSQEKQSLTNFAERSEITSKKSEDSENISGARNLLVTDLDQKKKIGDRPRRAVRRLNLDYTSRLNTVKDSVARTNNGTKPEQNQSQNLEPERLPTHEKTVEEELLQIISEAETKLKLCRNDAMNKQKAESPKRTHCTVNSVIKNVFKKSTCQAKSNAKANFNDQDEYHQAYTILKKPEASTTSGESTVPTTSGQEEEINNKLAQISIEDCKNASEVNTVLS